MLETRTYFADLLHSVNTGPGRNKVKKDTTGNLFLPLFRFRFAAAGAAIVVIFSVRDEKSVLQNNVSHLKDKKNPRALCLGGHCIALPVAV